MTILIVALGNPGNEYKNTRHNIGWMALEHLPFYRQLAWKEKFKSRYSQYNHKGEKYIFIEPQTFMNLSGESVRPAMDFFKIPLEDIIIIHDEIDLPFGTIQLKKGGGLAGNNGLKSIAQHLGSQGFKRIRMGVGRPKFGDVASHVLGNFNPDEQISLDDYLKLGCEAIESIIEVGFQKSQNKFSKRSVI